MLSYFFRQIINKKDPPVLIETGPVQLLMDSDVYSSGIYISTCTSASHLHGPLPEGRRRPRAGS